MTNGVIKSNKEFQELDDKTRAFFIYERLDILSKKEDTLAQKLDAYIDRHDAVHAKIRLESDLKYASKMSERIVYGLVGIILVAVATALVSTVVNALDIFVR